MATTRDSDWWAKLKRWVNPPDFNPGPMANAYRDETAQVISAMASNVVNIERAVGVIETQLKEVNSRLDRIASSVGDISRRI